MKLDRVVIQNFKKSKENQLKLDYILSQLNYLKVEFENKPSNTDNTLYLNGECIFAAQISHLNFESSFLGLTSSDSNSKLWINEKFDLVEPIPGSISYLECGIKYIKAGSDISKAYPLAGTFDSYVISNEKRPFLFLDRDGILIEDCGYPHKKEQLVFIEDCLDLIKIAQEKKWGVAILTNQAGIAKEKFNLDQYEEFNNYIVKRLSEKGIHIDSIQFCPYHREGTFPPYNIDSIHRKPHSGMLLEVAKSFHVDLLGSIMVGDKISDRLWLPGLTSYQLTSNVGEMNCIRSLKELFDVIKN